MNRFLKICFTIFITASSIFADVLDIDDLIDKFERENDLSKTTKRESVGHVSVFTRQDIDMLRLYTLEDLMNYIPFLKRNRTSQGLMDLGFTQLGRVSENLMHIYIDNQLLVFPYQGIGLKYYSKVNLKHVDHIEIYWGFPSFSFGISGPATVIRVYTKKADRENISTLGAKVSNSGSFGLEGYSAHSYDDFSYLLSVNHENIKEKKLYKYEDFPLSKNENTTHLFSVFCKGNSKFSINLLKGNYDGFLGESLSFQPLKNDIDIKHIYLTWDYKLRDILKLSTSYSYSKTDYYSKVVPLPDTKLIPKKFLLPTDFPSNRLDAKRTKERGLYEKKLKEQLFNIHLFKNINYKKHSIDFGYMGQHRKYKFDSYIADGIETSRDDFPFDEEYVSSFYVEDSYLLDDKDLLISSFKYNYYNRKAADDKNSFNGRFGYIHNDYNWYNKFFLHYGTNNGDSFLFANYFLEKQAKKTTNRAITNELGYRLKNGNISFFLTYGDTKEEEPYQASEHRLAGLNAFYNLNYTNYLRASLWVMNSRWHNESNILARMLSFSKDSYVTNRSGGYLALTSMFDKFIFTNSLFFNRHNSLNKNYIDYSTSITYRHDSNLEFFLKGSNLLNKAQDGFYYGIDVKKQSFTTYEPPLFERAVWFGMEYSF